MCKKEGVIYMKKTLTNMGGLILFYLVIIIGVLLLNLRFKHLNDIEKIEINNNYIAMNK